MDRARREGGEGNVAGFSEPDGAFSFTVPLGAVVDVIVLRDDGPVEHEEWSDHDAATRVAAPATGLELRIRR